MSEMAGVRIESSSDPIVAILSGEVDMSNSRAVARDLAAAVPNDAHSVVLDLSQVEYLDSSAIQMLFEMAERLAGRQQRIVYVVPDGSPLRRMLTIVALDDTAPIMSTRAEAEAAMA